LNPDGRARVRIVRATRSDLTSTSTSAPRLPDHASAARNRAAAEFARRVAISRRARASRMARAHESESATTSALSPTRYAHEERVLRTPHDVEAWCDYLDAIDAGDENDDDDDASRAIDRYMIYERAIKHNAHSYKLWYRYLTERARRDRGARFDDAARAKTRACFERALTTMHKMPKIWIMAIEYVRDACALITETRRMCDRALRALPVTQHERVWAPYVEFIRRDFVPISTARRVYRRYLKFEPGHAEEYVEFLRKKQCHGEVASKLAELVNDDSFQSLAGKSKHALWLELCDVVTKHPPSSDAADETDRALDVDAILRGGIRTFTNEVGRLWTALADYYIRRGLFEAARDVYEEGVESVSTVRDFSLIFDAYAQFEESVISAKMEAGEDEDEDEDADDSSTADPSIDFVLRDDSYASVELLLARLEHLMERRPELLSSVMLRQNPHNVHEWEKRVALFEGQPTKQILTYTEAVKTVKPELANGRVASLWVGFAKFYEDHGDLESAQTVFEKAVGAERAATFKTADDLATCWCEYAEMHLRHKNYDEALAVMRRATTPREGFREPRTAAEYDALPARDKVFKSLKMWTLRVDLEESLGDLKSTKAVYDAMISIKVATPQILLNYTHLLQEHNFFEDAFQVFERGVNSFKFPYSRELWAAYLTLFVARFKGSKLERARDLFEQVIEEAPAKESKQFFLAYAKLEEDYGLAKRAMDVYERAVKRVPVDERLGVYDVYVAKAMEFFGVAKVRDVFTRAADDGELSNDVSKTLTTRFAEFERKLGEIDRARALYAHASQFSDPTKDADFWSTWHEFEVRHGNEETFREMLRIKRAVAASFSDTHFNVSVVAPDVDAAKKTTDSGDAMARLDAAHEAHAAENAASMPGFVRSHVEGASPPAAAVAVDAGDDAEIDLDALEAPAGVFSGVKRDAAAAGLGAMARFKSARANDDE
jgi:pre-mRNA-splicing factor SYF1